MSEESLHTGQEGQNAPAQHYTPEEIEAMSTPELLNAYKQTGDMELKWPLVLRYEGLIKSAALQIRGVYSGFAQVDDIVNEGILTLLGAIDKFDPEKGIKFETYVSKRIRGMVIDLARKQDWLPRNIRRRAKEIDAVISVLSAELGHFPTDSEVAERLGVPIEKYQKDTASAALSNILSLDALMDSRDTDGYRFEVLAEDSYGQPETMLQERELQQVLAEGIQTLRENEQIVLSLYYEKNLHMKEIAQVMDVSKPRISQIHARAIQKLRDYMTVYLNGAPAQKDLRERKKG
ncbi:FliA/WhiG family RNA polymerase sigma factor [Pseudoflavonifractor sp. 524-17]|uniref:sigma-70 family RNA polymerase sigma factor n=1 Tax=Pseudoflavonifractor sp. 524-17 TaxID=2304577 RepID=UPI00137B6AEF|nr:FliA/WhiG family RNA polymerase sigma factor [Pseudoflavonifractor sp. 524-17]NCE65531.1 FliA/WhiG family RNA polymerase sigma factor [Pseudoflavonifractor sp. 524-17]